MTETNGEQSIRYPGLERIMSDAYDMAVRFSIDKKLFAPDFTKEVFLEILPCMLELQWRLKT